MLERGFLTVGRWGAVPIRLHWTLPIGLFIFTGLVPGAAVGYVAIILLHEVGHALLVRRAGLRVGSLSLYGFGGECQYFGQPTPLERSVIAWGGVLAQLALLFAADAGLRLGGVPRDHFSRELTATVAGEPNAIILAINLLPIGRLDGREAWRLFPRLWRRLRRPRRPRRRHPLH